MIGFPLKVSLPKKCPTPFSNEPTTGGSIVPVLLAIQYKLHNRVLGSKRRRVRPSKSLPSCPGNWVVEYVSISAAPPRILWFSSKESNSVHSLQFSSRLLRWRLCIFHLPTRKSKSFGDEADDAVMTRLSFASKVTFGIGMDSSAARAGVSARPRRQTESKTMVNRHF